MNVSRETMEQLRAYQVTLIKWNAKINLISRNTTEDAWIRHIEDSAQLWGLVEPPETWVDMGSGGGLPGIVLAIMAKGCGAKTQFTLIESDQRKAVFLRTVVREQNLNAKVIVERIEAVEPQGADVISARALASLDDLLGFGYRHIKTGGTLLLPKGKIWKKEVEAALKNWAFTCTPVASETEPEAAVLKIEGLQRV